HRNKDLFCADVDSRSIRSKYRQFYLSILAFLGHVDLLRCQVQRSGCRERQTPKRDRPPAANVISNLSATPDPRFWTGFRWNTNVAAGCSCRWPGCDIVTFGYPLSQDEIPITTEISRRASRQLLESTGRRH